MDQHNSHGESGCLADGEGSFNELRESAEAVLASIKLLLETTERVIKDSEAMAMVAARGSSFVDSFTKGFRSNDNPDSSKAPDSGQ